MTRPVVYVGENDATLILRMPKSMKEWLKSTASSIPDCTTSDLVRKIIRGYIGVCEDKLMLSEMERVCLP
jgi:predicted DNA-binding protein